jgi:uncharacterized protein (TIGR02246 family)
MIRNRSLALACLGAAYLVAACSSQPLSKTERSQLADRRAADEAAITAAGVALGQAAAAKDIDQCMSFYVDDPVLFVPGAPAVVGKDALRKVWQQFFNVQALKLETSGLIIDVAGSGDLAFERGSYSNTITDAKGKVTTETGKLVLVWKKQADGSWKIAADTNASDK